MFSVVLSAFCALAGITVGMLVARSARADAEKRVAEAKENAARLVAEVKSEAARQRDEAARLQKEAREQRDIDFEKQLKAMEAQFAAASERMLKERTEDFKGANKEQMEKITQPLLREIDEMRKAMKDNKEGSDKNISALSASIRTMLDSTNKIGEDAKNLANALKNHGKVQGDWGEQVLSDILRDSSMVEGREYFTQKNFKGTDNNDLRPDVVVKFPDESQVIVDSKVSLTAYSEYLSAVDDKAREQAVKANRESIWKHIEELAQKNYPKYVPNSMPYVLMFVPNEGSYILAMNDDPQIGIKAFKKNVIIVNPTNLMLVLNLVLSIWHNTHQEENCQKIMAAAENLYDKFCGFSDTFVKVGKQLETVRSTYDTAQNQLKDGRDNIIRQLTKMQELGVNSAKQIPEKLTT